MSDIVEKIKKLTENTLISNLGIEITSIEEGKIIGTMPVDARTVQSYGILHGGASAAFAETLGSIGSNVLLFGSSKIPVGLQLNANFIKSVSSGVVTGVAELLHKGRTTHIWNITITGEKNELICVSRLTVIVKDQNG
ncbi:MAG: PaaI family thioesterase [Bacteroidia bacterium]